MKEFEDKHDIIGQIYNMAPKMTFILKTWTVEKLKEIYKLIEQVKRQSENDDISVFSMWFGLGKFGILEARV